MYHVTYSTYSGKGQTPAESNTCYDTAPNCFQADCKNKDHIKRCRKHCKKCDSDPNTDDTDSENDANESKPKEIDLSTFDDDKCEDDPQYSNCARVAKVNACFLHGDKCKKV